MGIEDSRETYEGTREECGERAEQPETSETLRDESREGFRSGDFSEAVDDMEGKYGSTWERGDSEARETILKEAASELGAEDVRFEHRGPEAEFGRINVAEGYLEVNSDRLGEGDSLGDVLYNLCALVQTALKIGELYGRLESIDPNDREQLADWAKEMQGLKQEFRDDVDRIFGDAVLDNRLPEGAKLQPLNA